VIAYDHVPAAVTILNFPVPDISDMGRPPDARAGCTLLDQLRGSGNQTPFVIYASSRAPEHVRESRAHGAIGCTNSLQELIAMVTTGLAAR